MVISKGISITFAVGCGGYKYSHLPFKPCVYNIDLAYVITVNLTSRKELIRDVQIDYKTILPLSFLLIKNIKILQ